MESSRFPDKPMAKILNKAMIQWVYEKAIESNLSDVFIVTDSRQIAEFAKIMDANVVMTSSDPLNGTERCREALNILDPDSELYDIIINIQGDEPLLNPEDINEMLNLFDEDEVDIATFIQAIESEKEYLDPNVVKAVPTLFSDNYCDINYFSRSPIPYMKEFKQNCAFRHVGIYGFTRVAFEEISSLQPSILELEEQLEQLRWLQNHLLISGIRVKGPYIGVDTREDLLAVENILTSKS
jgi:3-deoxy-manno-octulosonate cytidylyltransferase (CMP-KDO synthetase)